MFDMQARCLTSAIKIKREGLEKRKPVFPEAASQHYFSCTRCQIQEGFQMAFTDGETEAQGVEKKKKLCPQITWLVSG